MKKCLSIILAVLLSFFLVSGMEECLREQERKDVPCYLVTATSPVLSCINYAAYFYSEDGTYIQAQTFSQIGDSGRCNVTFNLSTTGQYYVNSSIGTWNVTLYQEKDMLSIILLQLFLIIFFIMIGLPHKAGFIKVLSWGMGVIELLMTVWMIYVNEMGQTITTYLYTNAIAVLIIGGFVGFITLFKVMVNLSLPHENKTEDDAYTKWLTK
jgi:hypothetical protein